MKFFSEKLKGLPKWLRLSLLSVLGAAVLGGGIYGILLLIRGQGSTVNVYPVRDISNYFASSGNAQTQGMVTTDKVQSVYISNTQQVTKIHVRQGQRVAVGDPLISFDTTLTDLGLERQGISVRQLELDLQNAIKRQAEINTYTVYVPVTPAPDPELPPTTVGVARKGAGSKDDPFVYIWNDTCSYSQSFVDGLLPHMGEGGEIPAVYAVFEVRAGDSLKGSVQRCWELVFRRAADDSWSFTLIEADYDPSTGEDDEKTTDDSGPSGPSYSWNDLNAMKREAAQKIVDLELKLKMAQLKYETLQYELSSGVVTSKIDGVVKTLRDVEAARGSNEPLLLVSGGGGYYVTGAMSETELATMHIGDTVNVRSWETYETLTGTITNISEFPYDSGYAYHYSNGNQNVTLYPFTVFLPEDSSLRENEYVEITYDASQSSGSGLCLMNAFIRTENGQSYIWVANAAGKLEKRQVQTGRSLYGSYLEIVSDLSAEDYVAFPYGRSLREGAPTQQSTAESLYSGN